MDFAALTPLASDKDLTKTLFNNFPKLFAFVFYAPSHAVSADYRSTFEESLQLFALTNVLPVSVDAEKCPETCKKFGVEVVPTVILTRTDKKVLEKWEGSDMGTLWDRLAEVSAEHQSQVERDLVVWRHKVEDVITSAPVVIFIKGTPTEPKCGFTSTLLEILDQASISYVYYDIITDEYMRYWLRHLKGWPTYPQVFCNGALVGGLDKIKDIKSKGELEKVFPQDSKVQDDAERFAQIKQMDAVLITEGFPFEHEPLRILLEKIKEKLGPEQQQKLKIVNLDLDAKLKERILNEKLVLPCFLLKGVVSQI